MQCPRSPASYFPHWNVVLILATSAQREPSVLILPAADWKPSGTWPTTAQRTFRALLCSPHHHPVNGALMRRASGCSSGLISGVRISVRVLGFSWTRGGWLSRLSQVCSWRACGFNASNDIIGLSTAIYTVMHWCRVFRGPDVPVIVFANKYQ